MPQIKKGLLASTSNPKNEKPPEINLRAGPYSSSSSSVDGRGLFTSGSGCPCRAIRISSFPPNTISFVGLFQGLYCIYLCDIMRSMLLIAVDGNGCHSFTVEVSQRRYERPDYMEALYNSIEMVFKKLKYHKGKMDITITEVSDYDAAGEEQTREAKILENDAFGTKTSLAPPEISSGYLTYKPRDKRDKADT